MHAAMMAMPQQQAIKPAFTVKKLDGEVPHTVHAFDKTAGRIRKKVVNVPAGYLVQFARGHSIRCFDEAHLRRVGAGMQFIPLVNGETGEVVGTMPNNFAVDEPSTDEAFDLAVESGKSKK